MISETEMRDQMKLIIDHYYSILDSTKTTILKEQS
jgi:hypothetical protein